jgi:hypothetical protein
LAKPWSVSLPTYPTRVSPSPFAKPLPAQTGKRLLTSTLPRFGSRRDCYRTLALAALAFVRRSGLRFFGTKGLADTQLYPARVKAYESRSAKPSPHSRHTCVRVLATSKPLPVFSLPCLTFGQTFACGLSLRQGHAPTLCQTFAGRVCRASPNLRPISRHALRRPLGTNPPFGLNLCRPAPSARLLTGKTGLTN